MAKNYLKFYIFKVFYNNFTKISKNIYWNKKKFSINFNFLNEFLDLLKMFL